MSDKNSDRTYEIAVIPGDGIGKEVMPEGVRALEAAARRFGFAIRQTWHDFASCDYYAKHGTMMPEDWEGAHRASVSAVLRGRRLAGYGAGPRVPVGLAASVPP